MKKTEELKACIYDTENVYSKLNQLSENIRKTGVVIAIAFAILGLVIAISLIVETKSTFTFLSAISICALIVIFAILSFNAIALIIEALGCIVYNTSLPAIHDLHKIEEDKRKANLEISKSNIENSYDKLWICKNCGEKNEIMRMYCTFCGEHRANTK